MLSGIIIPQTGTDYYWGTALAPYGCFFFLWQYDYDYMSNTTNQDAFKAIADLVASTPARSCKRA